MGLRARQLNLPAPGAIASGTPMSDVTKVGDTFYTNELVDNVLVSRDGFCDAAAEFYAHGHDMKDPLSRPSTATSGFAPTILTSGTRDLLLSNTVRVHRKLRDPGIDSFLQVYEGQSHAHYCATPVRPETTRGSSEITCSSTSTWRSSGARNPHKTCPRTGDRNLHAQSRSNDEARHVRDRRSARHIGALAADGPRTIADFTASGDAAFRATCSR